MVDELKDSRLWIYFTAVRPRFLTASAGPVLVGSALGFAVTGDFSFGLFLLALLGTVLLHSGANVANDYYDHLSGNDAVNKNPTPFSGGRRYIQDGILSAKATLTESLVLLVAGSVCGLVIVLMTKSVFILVLGLIGLLGGFFYTAGPVKLCYRSLGEITIALLFGILPVVGSYYLQTGSVDLIVFPAAFITGILIFLIILINEFPDIEPDSQSNKKTLVVRFGVKNSVTIYRSALVISYIIAAVTTHFLDSRFAFASIAYFLTAPLGIINFWLANTKDLTNPERFVVNALTILLHLTGVASLSVGFVISGILGQ